MLLQVDHLSVRFSPSAPAVLDDVSFSVAAGSSVALVGESGSGKSTLLLSLVRLLPLSAQTSGQIQFDGQSILDLPRAKMATIRGKRIGVVFQEPTRALNPVFTIREQLLAAVVHASGDSEDVARRSLDARLFALGFERAAEILDRYPHQISVGMRQRVLVAIALAGSPPLVMADEPTSALDLSLRMTVLDLISQQKQQGRALLWATHDLALAKRYSDSVVVLEAGKVVEAGLTREVLQGAKHAATLRLLDAAKFAHARKA